MSKRVLSILTLCCVLLASTVPASAAINDTGFSDVSANAWYADAVVYCRDNGLISGTTATTFSPSSATSRAMLAAILYRQVGSPANAGDITFGDTERNTWYSNAVSWAVGNSIFSGYTNGNFGPNDAITREQVAAILWRDAGRPIVQAAQADFADENTISSYAAAAVDWAREKGIVAGKANNLFDPKGNVTRGETAAMLYRYLNTGANPLPEEPEVSTPSLSIVAGGRTFNAKLHDNASVKALLAQMPFTLQMDDFASQEKVATLPFAMSSAPTEVPARINAGDIYLWSGNNLVLFYTTFSNAYSYVPIGYIEDVAGLRDALGNGSVQVTFR